MESQHDYEHYLTTLFIPAPARRGAWAVRAFNVETALIRENVKDVNIGKMRIQWWRDTIDKTFAARPPNHPVAQALAYTLETSPLSQSWFRRLLTERESNMADPHYATTRDLELYGENTASSILYLLLETLGVRDHQADHAAGHLGKAIGIVTMLRGTPFHIQERRFYLPSEVMAKYSVSTEEVFRNGPNEQLEEAVFEVATAANDQLITSRSFAKDTPERAVPALLASIPCEIYLQALEKANFNVFDPSLRKRNWRLPLSLWNSGRKRVY
ncbi:NADH dehydrogenase (ubiquinone) complex I, assembly factor 6 [Borealophlyctis nickersoniae]|nr:NADH dehydrogenase (ubiquinone) complex I, assembly factor 6 [Borealophlyctis nickersoniae]